MGSNPLQKLLMGRLQQVNPAGYNFLAEAMKSNKNPEQVLNELIKNNQVTPVQLNQVKEQAAKYGAPQDILNKLG